MDKRTRGMIRPEGCVLLDDTGREVAVVLGVREAYLPNAVRLAACWNAFENPWKQDHPDKARFDCELEMFAKRNKKLKKLLEEIGPYEKQNENIRSLIDKELGIKRWITYPVYDDAMPPAAPTPPAQEDEPIGCSDGCGTVIVREGPYAPYSKLRKAAEELHTFLGQLKPNMHNWITENNYMRLMENLRAALEGK